MRAFRVLVTGLILVMCSGLLLYASDEATMMRFPDIHKNQITFSYGGDIWISNLDGDYARRLTTSEGVEYFPKFSPDGKWIAFTGQYNGYFQVFVVPAIGGSPRQLTFYPIGSMTDRAGFNNQVMDWTPDGKYIVYRSIKYHWDTYLGRYYKISPEGGWPEPLPFSEGSTMSYSPDGGKIAFNRIYRDFRTWKRYRGGKEQNIWMYDFEKDTVEKFLDWKTTEINPMWHENDIYFVSDKTGVLNLYKINTKTKKDTQLTNYKDWDVRWPGFGPKAVIFELGGKLYRMPFTTEKVEPISVKIAYDMSNLDAYYKKVAKNVEDYHLAPTGKRAVFIARGELFTVPAEKGNIRNLSESPGVREKSCMWSPDGKWIAYLADDTGTEELYVTDPKGNKTIQLTKNSEYLIQSPVWSPDSKKIAFRDLDKNLFYIDVKTRKKTLVDKSRRNLVFAYRWSPDSKWLTYTKLEDNNFTSIYLYSINGKKIYKVTDDLTFDYGSAFDPTGKYLYFLSNRSFEPTIGNFELSYTYNNMAKIYMFMLKKDTPNPFEPESDEVEPVKDEDEKDKNKKDKKKDDKVKVEIDIEGLSDRIAVIPIKPANINTYFPVKDGVLYIKPAGHGKGFQQKTGLFGYDLKKKKETAMLTGANGFVVSPDGEKLLYKMGHSFGIADAKIAKIDPGKDKLNLSEMETRIDPKAEWKQMLIEAWRLEKNFFYVKNMHGVDWDKILKKYLTLVDHLTHRRDLTYIIGEMVGELSAGHTYVGGGEMPEPKSIGTGLLGAEFEPDENGYFKITKIYIGENWHKETRSPLTEPGIKAKVGDYILEINGKALKLPDNPYRLLQKTLGTTVTLKLGTEPEGGETWEVKVKPIADESELQYIDWVEMNRKKVEKATNGRVGYVHIPDMSFHGLNQFVKTYFGQLDKDGIIIDERYNGGGFVSGAILERLRRFIVGIYNSRIGGMDTYPTSAYSGKLVMLINNYAASDGDIFPYFFKEYDLGPVIGTTTWGGVIGISGYTSLMDGGYVTIPTIGLYGMEGDWIVENRGAEPTMHADLLPNDEARGNDTQLRLAIKVIMKMIKEDKFEYPKPEPAPVR